MTAADDLVADIEAKFERGTWFVPAEVVLRTGRWSGEQAGFAVAAGRLARRPLPRHDVRRAVGGKIAYEYCLL